MKPLLSVSSCQWLCFLGSDNSYSSLYPSDPPRKQELSSCGLPSPHFFSSSNTIVTSSPHEVPSTRMSCVASMLMTKQWLTTRRPFSCYIRCDSQAIPPQEFPSGVNGGRGVWRMVENSTTTVFIFLKKVSTRKAFKDYWGK